jgi:hypothetical protein
VAGKVDAGTYASAMCQKDKALLRLALCLYPQHPFPETSPTCRFRILMVGTVNDEKQNWEECAQSGGYCCVLCLSRIHFAGTQQPERLWDTTMDGKLREVRYVDASGTERTMGPILYNYQVWVDLILPDLPKQEEGEHLGHYREACAAVIDKNRMSKYQGVGGRPPALCFIWNAVVGPANCDSARHAEGGLYEAVDMEQPPFAGWKPPRFLPPQPHEDSSLWPTMNLTELHFLLLLWLICHTFFLPPGMHTLQGTLKDLFEMLESTVHFAGTKSLGLLLFDELRKSAMNRTEVRDGVKARDLELCVARLANPHTQVPVSISIHAKISPDADPEDTGTVKDVFTPMGYWVLMSALDILCALKQPFRGWCVDEDGERLALRHFDWMPYAQRRKYFRTCGAVLLRFKPCLLQGNIFRGVVSSHQHFHTMGVHMPQAVLEDRVGNDGYHESGFGATNHQTRKTEKKTLMRNIRDREAYGKPFVDKAKSAPKQAAMAAATSAPMTASCDRFDDKVTDSHTRRFLSALRGFEPRVMVIPMELLRDDTPVGRALGRALRIVDTGQVEEERNARVVSVLDKPLPAAAPDGTAAAHPGPAVVALVPIYPETAQGKEQWDRDRTSLAKIATDGLALADIWGAMPNGPTQAMFDATSDAHQLAVLLLIHRQLQDVTRNLKPRVVSTPTQIGKRLLLYLQTELAVSETGASAKAYIAALKYLGSKDVVAGKTPSELAALLGQLYEEVEGFPTGDFLVPVLTGLVNVTVRAGWRNIVSNSRTGAKVLEWMQMLGKVQAKGKNVKAYKEALEYVGARLPAAAKAPRAAELAVLLSVYATEVAYDPIT